MIIPKYRKPTHPGILIQDTIYELRMTRVELAKRLGISQQKLRDIIRGNASVTADIALQLSNVFRTTAKYWLNLQKTFDLSK
jgi:antitoxin HigA-1